MEKLVYSVQEVADMLGISKSYAYELIKHGDIPSILLGKKRVIPKERFVGWLNQKEN